MDTLRYDAVEAETGEGWRRRAACQGVETHLFFPVGEGPAAMEQVAAAKAVCGSCPVQAPCLEFALATNQQAGIWGGATEEERRTIRRRRRRQRRAS